MAKNKQIVSLFSSTLLWRKEQTDSLFYDNTDTLLLSGLVGTVNFKGNPNDEKILEKTERMTGVRQKMPMLTEDTDENGWAKRE